MSDPDTDEADEAEEPRTRQDYVVAKHDRAAKPGDGAHDPAEDFEGVGGGFDPGTLDLGDTNGVAKDTDGSDGEELQDTLEQAAAETWHARAERDEDLADLELEDVDWQAHFEDQQASEKEVLLEIRDRLEKMEQGAASDEAVAKALEQAAEGDEAGAEGGGPDSSGERALEQTKKTLEMLEALREGEAEDGGQGGAPRKGVAVKKSGGGRLGQLTRESWQDLADCLSGEAREAYPVE
jgi:hypothetical protein